MLSSSLRGICVIDLSWLYPGPLCTLMLADLGADVIKVESLEGEPGRSYPLFLQLNRGKRSITLDLKQNQTIGILKRMLTGADVLVESFRPGAMNRLGLAYQHVGPDNPGLIYCSITGYGSGGPYSEMPGHDLNYISIAGVLSLNGKTCLIPPVQIADLIGGFQAAAAILAALFEKQRTGNGQFVEISLLDGALFSLIQIASMHFSGIQINQKNLPLSGSLACYNVYLTGDRKHLAVAVLEPKFWKRFCQIMQMTPQSDQIEMIKILRKKFVEGTLEEWMTIFKSENICVTPVKTFEEALCDQQISERGLILREPYSSLRTPFVRDPSALNPAPQLGQHTSEILRELGYSDEQLASFRAERII